MPRPGLRKEDDVMGQQFFKVMIVDDEQDLRWSTRKLLESEGFDIEEADKAEVALESVAQAPPDVILLDYRLGGLSGLDALPRFRASSPETRILFMTAHGDHKTAVTAMRLGADDFIKKPFDHDDLLFRVHRLLHDPRFVPGTLKTSSPALISCDESMVAIQALLRRAASTRLPVLLQGESGSGKELLARFLHYDRSNPRCEDEFVSLNCAALHETLLESELFGHEPGAFTGAVGSRPGLFAKADRGTIFLDEIGEASEAVQTKLLRVLDSGEYRPLGSDHVRTSAARVVAATNRNLREEVDQGRFREDLYQRLKGILVEVPPLRERPGDVRPLVRHFLKDVAEEFGRHLELSEDVWSRLEGYPWPGNVRELYHLVQTLAVMSATDRIEVGDLPEILQGPRDVEPQETVLSFVEAKKSVVEDFERHFLRDLLERCQGNVSESARQAQMNRRYLTEKLSYYQLGRYTPSS